MNYQNTRSIITLLCLFFMVMMIPRYAFAIGENYDEWGFKKNKTYMQFSPEEYVNLFSGNLVLTHTDVVLPGNGGLDLKIQRTYNSKIFSELTNVGFTISGSVFGNLGVGWEMHFGRINTLGSILQIQHPILVEMPDGSIKTAFTNDQSNISSNIASSYVTEDFWFIDGFDHNSDQVIDEYVMKLPDGTTYTFDHRVSNSLTYNNYYVTSIDDTNGNTITFEYYDCCGFTTTPDTGTIGSCSPHGPNDTTSRHLKKITDSVGREIHFTMDNATCHENAIKTIDVFGDIYTYNYSTVLGVPGGDNHDGGSGKLLLGVDPPVGPSWDYDYLAQPLDGHPDGELIQITHPSGGTIDYTYETFDLELYDQSGSGNTGNFKFRALTSRTTSGPNITNPGTWTFDYHPTETTDKTTVTDACGNKEVYNFFGLRTGSFGGLWKIGLLDYKQTLDAADNPVETTTNVWNSYQISNEGQDNISSPSINGTYLPLLISQDISRDGKNYSTTFTYNEFYDSPTQIMETGEFTRTTDITYFENLSSNIFGKPASTTVNQSGESKVITNSYDPAGNLTMENQYGVITEYGYFPDGNLNWEKNARNFYTVFDLYDNGLATVLKYGATDNAGGSAIYTENRSINWEGTIASHTDGKGNTTSFTYDGINRLTQITPPPSGEAVTDIVYDDTNGRFDTVSKGNSSLHTTYDGFGRKIGTQTAAGVQTEIQYDVCGRKSYESLPYDTNTPNTGNSYTYDALDRLKSITRPDSTVVSYTYSSDADGSKITVNNENNQNTTMHYKAFGDPDDKRLVKVTDALTNATGYTYDLLGNIVQVGSPNGTSRSYSYNDKNFLVSETHPESGTTSYSHDEIGNVTSKMNAKSETTSYAYDPVNRLTNVNNPGAEPDVDYGYDFANNRTSMVGIHPNVEQTYNYTYTYDASNRLTNQDVTVGSDVSYSVDYAYDVKNNVTSIIYPSGETVNYDYDAQNRILNILDGTSNNISTNFNYIASGAPTHFESVYGVDSDFTYDTRQRLKTLQISRVFPYLLIIKEGLGDGTVIGTDSSSTQVINCGDVCAIQSPAEGVEITLTQTPDTGSNFVGWSGDPDCTDDIGDPMITMQGTKVCIATYGDTPVQVELTVTKDGTGTGTVTSTPAGIDCGADCSEFYNANTEVTLSANPAAGDVFAGWSGGAGDCDDGTVTMDVAKTCNATFNTAPPGGGQSTLMINANGGDGTGTVTSNPAGIDCGATCSNAFDNGTVVALIATPDTGSSFIGWTGDADCSDGRITIDANKSCTAEFDDTAPNQYTLNIGVTGSGSISSSPAGIDCGADCTESFVENTEVVLSAAADTGYTFTGWSGDPDCADGVVSMIADKTCDATFIASTGMTFSLSVLIDPAGTGLGDVVSSPAGIDCGPNCSADFDENQSVILTPLPSLGSTFTGWSGDPDCTDDGVGGVAIVSMNAVKSCTATFDVSTLVQHQVSVTKSGMGSGLIISNPSGIDCRDVCDANFDENSIVTLSAVPDLGSTFVGWSGDCAGTDEDVSLTISNAVNCNADFDALPIYTFSIVTSGTGTGTVKSEKLGIDCGTDCSEDYYQGTEVTLIPTPDPGSIFIGWKGDNDCFDGIVTITKPNACEAIFDLVEVGQYVLTINKIGGGDGIVTSDPVGLECGNYCQKNFDENTVITLTATADELSEFVEWGADCPGGVVTLDADKTCDVGFKGTTFAQFQTLVPSNVLDQTFGADISIDGDTAVIGALGHPSGEVIAKGIAFVFERDNSGIWNEVQILDPRLPGEELYSGGGYKRDFGSSISLRDDVLVVGSPREYNASTNSDGAAYIYRKNMLGVWEQAQKLTPTDALGFGTKVQVLGDNMVIGSSRDDGSRGAVYAYRKQPSGTWVFSKKLSPSELEPNEEFGSDLVMDGDYLFVANPNDTGSNYQGSVYVYKYVPGFGWVEKQVLTSTTENAQNSFGTSIELKDDVAYIGTYTNQSTTFMDIYRLNGDNVWTYIERYPIDGNYVYTPDFTISGDIAVSNRGIFEFNVYKILPNNELRPIQVIDPLPNIGKTPLGTDFQNDTLFVSSDYIANSVLVYTITDYLAPTINVVSIDPPPNQYGVFGPEDIAGHSNITVTFECIDNSGTGIDTCTNTQSVPTSDGVHQVVGTATDNDGNTSITVLTIVVDTQEPIIEYLNSEIDDSTNPPRIGIDSGDNDDISGSNDDTWNIDVDGNQSTGNCSREPSTNTSLCNGPPTDYGIGQALNLNLPTVEELTQFRNLHSTIQRVVRIEVEDFAGNRASREFLVDFPNPDAPNPQTLTVTTSGNGIVTSFPTGIDCGADCTEDYGEGTVVTLTATPDPGWTFTAWSGDADCTDGEVTMDMAKSCTATFDMSSGTQHTLTVTKSGTGTGTITSSPAGIDCGADCIEDYDENTVVTLTPTPDAGSTFTGWSGDPDCSDGSVTMDTAKTCTATFDLSTPTLHTLNVTKTGTGTGTVTSTPTGIDCGADCTEDFNEDTSVTLIPTPDTGSSFVGWTGDPDCSDGVVTVDAAKTCTATFDTAATQHTLTITKAGAGTGTVMNVGGGINCGTTCNFNFNDGTSVILTATADPGSAFVSWSGDADCDDGIVSMDTAKTCTATFEAEAIVPILLEGSPGTAGSVSTFVITGATPNSQIELRYGTSQGSSSAMCTSGSTTYDIAGASLIGNAVADSFGNASIDVSIPSNFVGVSLFMQALDKTACATTNLLTQTFDVPGAVVYPILVSKDGTGDGTVTTDPQGLNCGVQCAEVYAENDLVTLIATPANGSVFSGWSGAADDCFDGIVTMDMAKNCIATFDIASSTQHTLTVSKGGTGTGTVTSSPAGISCGTDCTEDYNENTVVTLTPSPDSGSTFVGWTGDADCSDGNVTMNAAKTCTATFDTSTPNQHTLTVSKAGTGTGTVTSSPTGISCGADCTEDYNENTAVTLTPTPDAGSTFTGWSGDADCSDGSVTMDAAKTCTATFDTSSSTQYTLTVSKAGTGTGTVTSSPVGIDCGADCTEDYDENTAVTLTPTPDAGSTFTGWSGDPDCSDGSVTMDAAKTCTATFDPSTPTLHTLNVTKTGTGTGTVTSTPTGIDCGADCTEDFNEGTSVTLIPTPDTGSSFVGWTGDPDCSDGVVTVDAAKTCTATFETAATQHTLTITKAGAGTGTVMNVGGGINCGTTCNFNFNDGTSVILTATADPGSAFVSWSGDTDCDDGIVSMDTAKTCTATFEAEAIVPILLEGSPGTAGSISTFVITGATPNSQIELRYGSAQGSTSATCTSGSTTYDIAGANIIGNGVADSFGNTSIQVSIPSSFVGVSLFMQALDKTACATTNLLTQTFSVPGGVVYDLLITKDGTGDGTVTTDPQGLNCGVQCAEVYAENDLVTLIATPANGSVFSGWSGDPDCTDGLVTADSIKTCNATFDIASSTQHTLTVTKAGTGTGTVTSNPAGISCGADCTEDYNENTAVTLTPSPDSGSTFIGWTGDADCSDGSVTMNAAKTCTATFDTSSSTQYTLTVTKAGTGTGTVTSSPSGISCGGDCTENYNENTVVTLTPTPNEGSTFIGWSGDPDCSDGSVTMDAAKTCTATFDTSSSTQHTLTVSKAGTGTGTVTSSPAGISCGADCTENYNENTVVTLTPSSNAGSTFTGWSGDPDCSDGSVTMDAAKTCTATFDQSTAQQYLLTINRTGLGIGMVTSNPPGINCGNDCIEFYDENTQVVITATPFSGSSFTGWSGDADCSDGVVTMSSARTCTAVFASGGGTQQYTLSVTKSGTGTGTVTSNPAGINCGSDCSENYTDGTSVTLTATADTGSTFTGWSGDTDCSDGVVTVNSAKTCTATFDSGGGSQFTMQPLTPGTANANNTITVTGATPNGQVNFRYGFSPGTTSVSCTNGTVNVGIANATHLTTVSADSSGTASVTVFISTQFIGLTLYLQAVDLSTCTITNLLAHPFTSSSKLYEFDILDMKSAYAANLNSDSCSDVGGVSGCMNLSVEGIDERTHTINNTDNSRLYPYIINKPLGGDKVKTNTNIASEGRLKTQTNESQNTSWLHRTKSKLSPLMKSMRLMLLSLVFGANAYAQGTPVPFIDLEYNYDGVGNVTGITDHIDNNNSCTMGYDPLNRLTSAVGPWGAGGFTYDSIGNRTSKSFDGNSTNYSYDSATNRLLSGHGYDANGNITSGGPFNYTYDSYNRVKSATNMADDITYLYDGDGRRISQTVNGETTIFAYGADSNVLTELKLDPTDSMWKPSKDYIYAGRLNIAVVEFDTGGTSTGKKFYHADHLGSAIALTDNVTTVVWDRTYFPYGGRFAGELSGPVQNTHQYTGKEFDEDFTQLAYYGARYYNPSIGRFMSVDPAGIDITNPQSWNRYAYVQNNPFSYVDPDGEILETAWDVFNISLGVISFKQSVSKGNYFDALLDAGGIAIDSAAAVIPVIPGGVGTIIKASRAGKVAAQLAKNANRVNKVIKNIPNNGILDPKTIRFTQDSAKRYFKDGRSVEKLINDLKLGKVTAADVPPIKIFQSDGLTFSLDNRRLHAFQEAGVPIRVVAATAEEIAKAIRDSKFSTINEGVSIIIRK